MKIFNFYRKNTGNIGDQYSTPLKYFEFPNFDIYQYDLHSEVTEEVLQEIKGSVVIFGGGGLVANDYFEKNIKKIINSAPKKVIWWGVGHNSHTEENINEYPIYLGDEDLIGLRDFGVKFEWVPCSSCMHPLFNNEYIPTRKVVVYQHKHHPLNLDNFEVMDNYTEIDKVIPFLGSAEIVITNSYHGAYWTSLLGKKVLLVNPFSSKFHYFKNEIKISHKFEYGNDLINLPLPDTNLLEICIAKNIEFKEKIDRLIKGF